MIFSKRRISREGGVRLKKMEGEGVLLHLGTGDYFSLNSAGLFLWETCATPQKFELLCASFAREYALSPEKAETDLKLFLESLLKLQLIKISDSSA